MRKNASSLKSAEKNIQSFQKSNVIIKRNRMQSIQYRILANRKMFFDQQCYVFFIDTQLKTDLKSVTKILQIYQRKNNKFFQTVTYLKQFLNYTVRSIKSFNFEHLQITNRTLKIFLDTFLIEIKIARRFFQVLYPFAMWLFRAERLSGHFRTDQTDKLVEITPYMYLIQVYC